MSHNTVVRTLQVLTHLGLIAGLFIQPSLIIYSVLIYWFVGVVGVNVGLHRLIAHRSFKTHKLLEYIIALIGCVATLGSPLAWTAVHRTHHRHADKENDPHSPNIIGALRVWFGFWDIKSVDIVRDLLRSNFYVFLHQYYLLIIVSYVGVIGLFAGPVWMIYGYCIPAVLILHSTSAFNVIAHKHGYKTYDTDDESRNSWIASIITVGEGWHNNHHANSGNWKSGEKWWELDPPAWIIRMIKK